MRAMLASSLGFINRSSYWLNIVNIIAIKSHQFSRGRRRPKKRQHYYIALLLILFHFIPYRSPARFVFVLLLLCLCAATMRQMRIFNFIVLRNWLAGCRFDECAKPMRWNARFAIQWMRAETLHFIWSTLKHTYTDRRRARALICMCVEVRATCDDKI